MPDAVTCPQCDAPARVVDRAVLESTDGPVEHVRVRCTHGHHLFMPTALLGRRSTRAEVSP